MERLPANSLALRRPPIREGGRKREETTSAGRILALAPGNTGARITTARREVSKQSDERGSFITMHHNKKTLP